MFGQQAAPSLLGGMVSFQPGNREVDGGDCLALAKAVVSSQGGMTALAGGGQTLAAVNVLTGLPSNLCYAAINEITTSGAGGTDSVILPPAIPGTGALVVNDSGNSIVVFNYPGLNPLNNTGDQIYPLNSATPNSTSTSINVATGHSLYFEVVRIGFWKQLTA